MSPLHSWGLWHVSICTESYMGQLLTYYYNLCLCCSCTTTLFSKTWLASNKDIVIVCLKLMDSEVQGPQATRKWQCKYCALNWTIGQQHHLRTKEISKAKALLGCKNQMLHCSRINHVHFGVILAAWELYLSSNFNFIEQRKIS